MISDSSGWKPDSPTSGLPATCGVALAVAGSISNQLFEYQEMVSVTGPGFQSSE